jgi:hypothetical protein
MWTKEGSVKGGFKKRYAVMKEFGLTRWSKRMSHGRYHTRRGEWLPECEFCEMERKG